MDTSDGMDAASGTTADGEGMQMSLDPPEKDVCTEHLSPASETVPATIASAPDAFEATVLPATPQRIAGNALDGSQASPLITYLPEANHSLVASVMPQDTLEENRQLGQATAGATDIIEEPVHVTRTSARRRAFLMEQSTPRWDAALFGSAGTNVNITKDGRLASRLDDRTGLRAMLRSDVMFESAGVHNFIVFIASCPIDHIDDPLELGVLARHPKGGFRGIGYATEGSTRGGGIFENGAELLAAPTISSGDTLSIEVSIQDESLHHARFQINGQYITRPLDLSDMTTPFIPVVTLPANAALEIVKSVPTIPPAIESLALPQSMGVRRRPVKESEARVRIWDSAAKKIIAGNATPMPCNLQRYLQKYPHREVYDGQDKRERSQSGLSGNKKRDRDSDRLVEPSSQQLLSVAGDLARAKFRTLVVPHAATYNKVYYYDPPSSIEEHEVQNVLGNIVEAVDHAGRPEHQREYFIKLHQEYYKVEHEQKRVRKEAYQPGSEVIVAGRGRAVVLKILANRWRRVRLDDGTEFAVKQKDLQALDELPAAAKTLELSQYGATTPGGLTFGQHEDITSSWICCDKCQKWRRIPDHVPVPDGEVEWTCDMNTWDSVYNQCWVQEEPGAREPDIHEEGGTNAMALEVDETELSIVQGLGAETIWALSNGRLLCWVEEKPYAVAHEGESLADFAREFKIENSDVLLVNAAIDSRLRMSSVFAAGSTLVLPWMENQSTRLWHDLTTALIADGWKLDWVAKEEGRKEINYFPPGETNSSKAFRDLESVLRAYPDLLNTFDLATPITAQRFVDKLGVNRQILKPIFDVGDWVLAQWPHDALWYFAKVSARHRDGSYDLTYEDGDIEMHKDPNLVRELNRRERKQPRGNKYGRMYWSRKDRAWIAYHQGRRRVPGCHATIDECEKALNDFHAQNSTTGQSAARTAFQAQHNAMLAAASAARKRGESTSGSSSGRSGGAAIVSAMMNRVTTNGGGTKTEVVCPICLESTEDCDEPVLVTLCCHNRFHRSCLDEQVKVLGGRSACPTCRNTTAFHRQLRASRRIERFGGEEEDESFGTDSIGGGYSADQLHELIGRYVTTSKEMSGTVQAVDRIGRLVLETSNGSIEKVRMSAIETVSTEPVSEFRITMPLDGVTTAAMAWKAAAATAATLSAQQQAMRAAIAEASNSSYKSSAAMSSPHSSPSYSPLSSSSPSTSSSTHVPPGYKGRGRPKKDHRRDPTSRARKGTGQGFANGNAPAARDWVCEICDYVNGQYTRRCMNCSQGTQARSMVGRRVRTTNGMGTVAKSSGKGWIVVETDSGASYRMRLSQLWDYTIALNKDGTETTASGYSLPLPARPIGIDGNGPKNWSHSLLRKRVMTPHDGPGVVTEVIDKGWIAVKLDTGLKIKTRPGNVWAIDADGTEGEIISSFAKRTKALHRPQKFPPTIHQGRETFKEVGKRARPDEDLEEDEDADDEIDEMDDADTEDGEENDVETETLQNSNEYESEKTDITGMNTNDNGDDTSSSKNDKSQQRSWDRHSMVLPAGERRSVRSLRVGTRMECLMPDHSWEAGLVEYEHPDGTYSIVTEQGEVLPSVSRAQIRVLSNY